MMCVGCGPAYDCSAGKAESSGKRGARGEKEIAAARTGVKRPVGAEVQTRWREARAVSPLVAQAMAPLTTSVFSVNSPL